MTVTQLHAAPTTDGARPIDRASAEALAGQVMSAAAQVARSEASFLRLLGEFDASGAVRWWDGIASTAHWVAWTCSIAPGTAREHVRVARALRRLPLVAEVFDAGELSYSKVRELTRLVDHHDRSGAPGGTGQPTSDQPAQATSSDPADDTTRTDDEAASGDATDTMSRNGAPGEQSAESVAQPFDEARLIDLARASTASQLARTVAGYRAADGTQRAREAQTRVSWRDRADGCVQITAVLTPEQGAAVIAAVDAATAVNRPDEIVEGTEREPKDQVESAVDAARRSRVEGLVEIANHYLDSQPEDRSGEDRTTVVVEVSAADLVTDPAPDLDVEPTGETPATFGPSADRAADSTTGTTGASAPGVPAGTPSPPTTPPTTTGRCRIRGHAGIERETARRLCCDADILGILTGLDGEPLAVGRTQRFVTRAQRRALMLRDQHCQFTVCHQSRHLKAHHIISWLDGGPTDLDNLILLCQRHHTAVHEGGITITRVNANPPDTDDDAGDPHLRWRFTRPDGTVIIPVIHGHDLEPGLPPLVDFELRPLTGQTRTRALAEREELRVAHQRRRAALDAAHAELQDRYRHITRPEHPDAQSLFPVGGGAGYSLANCVDTLFGIRQGHRNRTGPGHHTGPAAA